jgi:hypothetical protein
VLSERPSAVDFLFRTTISYLKGQRRITLSRPVFGPRRVPHPRADLPTESRLLLYLPCSVASILLNNFFSTLYISPLLSFFSMDGLLPSVAQRIFFTKKTKVPGQKIRFSRASISITPNSTQSWEPIKYFLFSGAEIRMPQPSKSIPNTVRSNLAQYVKTGN